MSSNNGGSPRRLSTDSEEGGFRSPFRALPTALSPGYDPATDLHRSSPGQVYHIPITINQQPQNPHQLHMNMGQDFISKPTSMSIFRVEKTSRSQKEYSKRTRFLPEFQKSRLKEPEVHQGQIQTPIQDPDRGQRSPEAEEIVQIPVEPAGNVKYKETGDYSRILIKILDFLWTLSPALFLTIGVHFIDGMVGFHMYGICLMVFQSVLLASIVFYIFKWLDCRRSIEVKDEIEGSLCWPFMNWRLIALLMLLGVVSSSSVILLVVSIHFLEVIVALALTFCPVVFIALLNHLNREKKCPLELLTIAFVTYIGIILILIPALIYTNDERLQRNLYTGVGASLGSTLLAWPSSILLKYLRSKGVEDYSQGISAGFFGTILSLIIGFSLGAVNPVRIDVEVWWVVGLVILTFSGTLLTLLETKLGFYDDDDGTTEIVQKNVSFTRLRVYIFLMSLLWGIFRQIYRHRVPDIFSIFGVSLIVLCIILGIAYQRWYQQMKENQQKIDQKRPFLFIPWIFSK